MSKRSALIILGLLAFFGALVTFYGTNCFMSDVCNMFHDNGIIASLPILAVCAEFTLATVFVMRFYRYPMYKKAMINLYTIIAVCFSLIGFVTAILAGILVYGSFILPYPFFGYLILMLIYHFAVVAYCLFINITNRKKEDDPEKRTLKFKYVLYSILLPVLIYMAYNKLGAVLFMVTYAHFRTLYMTFILYLALLVPFAMLCHIVMYFMDVYKGKELKGVIVAGVIFVLNIVLSVAVMITGSHNPQFISAVSPALPLERLMTFPLDTIVRFVFMLLLSGYYLFYAIRSMKRAEK